MRISPNLGYQGQVDLFMYFNHNLDPDRSGKDADTTDFPYAKIFIKTKCEGFFKKWMKYLT